MCLSFSNSTCSSLLDNCSIETPLVTAASNKKQNGHDRRAIVIGSIVAVFCAPFFISLLVYLCWKKKKESEITSTSLTKMDMPNWNAARVFSYKEIKAATRNFKEIIGRGSFGSVYHGKLSDGKLVAVKVRLDRSQLSSDSFANEVYLLSQVRRQNLISLEGFCYESKGQILVYEYLSGGSLDDNLYGQNHKKVTLSWVRRLKIAVDAEKMGHITNYRMKGRSVPFVHAQTAHVSVNGFGCTVWSVDHITRKLEIRLHHRMDGVIWAILPFIPNFIITFNKWVEVEVAPTLYRGG